MNPFLARALCAVSAILALSLAAHAAEAPTPTARIVSAANKFLSILDDTQRQKAIFAFDDAEQRARWSNLPVTSVRRAGLSMAELTEDQRLAALSLLAAALSRKGLQKVNEIMEADERLKESSGGKPMFGKSLYYVSILGTPSEKAPWMLQFGGHHLALNVTIAGEHGVLTPSLIGAQPASYTLNGATVRPLGPESDKAVALLNTLDEGQRKQAVLTYKVADLVLGPGQDGKTIKPEGLKGSAMNELQKNMLLELIAEWSGIVHESAAQARMAEIKAGLNDTWFAWSGPTMATPGRNTTAYYRIQGATLVIEYAPQPLGGDPSLHLHTMYRDPANDYGIKVIGK